MKKGLLIVAGVLMLAGALQAGEIKLHDWPCALVPQNFMTMDVKMEVGYWIRVQNQSGQVIVLSQTDIHTYDGCKTIAVQCNFNATLAASITAVPVNGGNVGTFTVTITPTQISMPGGNVTVCAHLTNADLTKIAANSGQVKVATVQITVVPTV
jgi:hypothetical protein